MIWEVSISKVSIELIETRLYKLGFVPFHFMYYLLLNFTGGNGKYWGASGSEIRADAETPTKFWIELREPTKICIKTTDGAYLNEEKNGKLTVNQSGSKEATQWEF